MTPRTLSYNPSTALRTCLLFVVCLGCQPEGKSTLPDPPIERLSNQASVILTGPEATLEVLCELALTPSERAKGLMYRKSPLGKGHGMLFIMDEDDDHSFWMKNTYIPLDMIFITQDGVVAGIVPDTVPHTLTSRRCGETSRYVLEVDAGTAKRHGIAKGATVEFNLP